MITSKERELAFMQDLNVLLTKHNATLELTDDSVGNYTNGYGPPVLEVYMPTEWDSDGNILQDFTEIRLKYIP